MNIVLSNAATAYRNLERADAVTAVCEITGILALQQLFNCMLQHPIGQEILRDRLQQKQTSPAKATSRRT